MAGVSFTTTVSVPKLEGRANYRVWYIRIKGLLRLYGLWVVASFSKEYLEEVAKSDERTMNAQEKLDAESAAEVLEKYDTYAKHVADLIMASLSDKIIARIPDSDFDNGYDLLKAIKEKYGRRRTFWEVLSRE